MTKCVIVTVLPAAGGGRETNGTSTTTGEGGRVAGAATMTTAAKGDVTTTAIVGVEMAAASRVGVAAVRGGSVPSRSAVVNDPRCHIIASPFVVIAARSCAALLSVSPVPCAASRCSPFRRPHATCVAVLLVPHVSRRSNLSEAL